MPSIKETDFFAQVRRDVGRSRYLMMKVISKEEEYLRLFNGAGSKPVLGEACPSYLYDEAAPIRIVAKASQAKIVILLREPVERAYSHYLSEVREGMERRPFYYALMADAAQFYIDPGLYYRQVERYLHTFGSEQVRIYCWVSAVLDSSGSERLG